MSKGLIFTKTIYNGGKRPLGSLLGLESDLEVLQSSSINLKKTLKGLDSIESIVSRVKFYGGGSCVVDPEWATLLEKHVQDQIYVLPHHGIYGGRLMDALSMSTLSNFPGVIDKNKHQIYSINSQLRNLKQRLKFKFSREVLRKIRSLVLELHSLISFHLKGKRAKVKMVRISVHYYFARDIRNFIRNLIGLISKFLCDFSGTEDEDALFTTNSGSKQFSYFFQSQKKCLTQKNLLNPLMATLSRLNTNQHPMSFSFFTT